MKLTHAERMAAIIDTILKNPKDSIDEVCRRLLDDGVPVHKVEVTRIRTQMKQTLANTMRQGGLPLHRRPDPEALAMSFPVFDQNLNALAVREGERAAEEEAEAERKRKAQEEREAKWKARAEERLAQWKQEALEQEKETTVDSETDAKRGMLDQMEDFRQPVEAEVIATAPPPEARRRTTAGRMLRRQRLNEILDEEPGIDPLVLMGRIKEEFGIGLDWRYVYETCRVARDVHRLPQIPNQSGPHDRVGAAGVPMPTFPAAPDDDMEYADTPEEELEWLARQANDIMRAHGLTLLSVTGTGGKFRWRYERHVEADGEVTI